MFNPLKHDPAGWSWPMCVQTCWSCPPFPTFLTPTFVALSAVQRWESNTGSIPWNRLRYFTCAMVVTGCVRTTANTCKCYLGIPMALNGHSVSNQVRYTYEYLKDNNLLNVDNAETIVPFKDSLANGHIDSYVRAGMDPIRAINRSDYPLHVETQWSKIK